MATDKRPPYYAVRTVCGKRLKTVECLSVRLSACLFFRRSTEAAGPAGLLLRSGAGSRYRSIATASLRNAGSVNFCSTVRRSNMLVIKRQANGNIFPPLSFLREHRSNAFLSVARFYITFQKVSP